MICPGCQCNFVPSDLRQRYCTPACQVQENNTVSSQRRYQRKKQTSGGTVCTVCDAPTRTLHTCPQCGDKDMCADCALDPRKHYCRYAVEIPKRAKASPSTKYNVGFKAKVDLYKWLNKVVEQES